jgi:hypothetical protein
MAEFGISMHMLQQDASSCKVLLLADDVPQHVTSAYAPVIRHKHGLLFLKS